LKFLPLLRGKARMEVKWLCIINRCNIKHSPAPYPTAIKLRNNLFSPFSRRREKVGMRAFEISKHLDYSTVSSLITALTSILSRLRERMLSLT
jgi:hypothetical protein